MILTRDEFLSSVKGEVRILLHLISKVDSANLDYRPTPEQRSTLELLQYLATAFPIHLRACLRDRFDMQEWSAEWTDGKAAAKSLNLEQTKAAIAAQPGLITELLTPVSDESLRAPLEMFGATSSRGSWLAGMILSHYAAYRMQLFLYLKSSGHPELNTFNLWVGMDPPPPRR